MVQVYLGREQVFSNIRLIPLIKVIGRMVQTYLGREQVFSILQSNTTYKNNQQDGADTLREGIDIFQPPI